MTVAFPIVIATLAIHGHSLPYNSRSPCIILCLVTPLLIVVLSVSTSNVEFVSLFMYNSAEYCLIVALTIPK